MAKTITDEKIKLSVIIDGNIAQKELNDLDKALRELNSQQKELRVQKQLLEKQGKKDTDQYRALTASIRDNNTAIAANKAKTQELVKEIGIAGLTMKQLTDKATMLKFALRNAVPGTDAFKAYEKELKDVQGRIAELSGRAQAAKFSIGGLADSFNRYQGLAISMIATLTGVVFSIQKMIDYNGKLSDAQANVMKTTKMTKEEVDDLGKSFGLLETRTSRIDLYKIAEQGGRLGIPKAEIQNFVKEMNVAAVALGDSFTGGVDEVAEKLGKIKFLFKETQDMGIERAYNSIGSAINELGADGVASEANIAEFTKRIGSLTDVLKPTVQETLALGAAFEESGIEAETSSRAYNIFMKQASTESAKFAKVMGISQKAVEDLINENPLDFMLNFSKGLNGMNATEVAKTLDFLGINADGANKVIGAMGNNFDRFHDLIDLSNKSFSEGTSLITEYNVKNENLAATLEKVGKKVSSWFSSENFTNWLGGAVLWFAKFIGATQDADGSVAKWKNTLAFTAKVIGIITAAIITNVGWQKLIALWTTRNTEATLLYTIASKARAVADAISIIGSQALAAVQMLLAGNVRGAAQAFRVMTATMMTTPWGFILGAVAAIGTAYLMFSKEAKAAATAQSMMAETAKKTADLVEKESQTFMSLMAIINDTTASTEARNAALVKAKEIGGEYTKGLTLENAATSIGKDMIDKYIDSLTRKMQLQVLEAKQTELLTQIQDRKNKKLDEEVDVWDKIWSATKNAGNASGTATDLVVTAAKKKQEALSELQRQLNLTNAEMKAFLEANPNLIKTIGTEKSNYKIPEGKDDKDKVKKDTTKTQEQMTRERLDAEQKFQDEYLKLRRQLEDNDIALMKDGYDKEMAIENLRYKREIEDLENKKVRTEEMAKLDEAIAKSKKDGDTKYYNFLIEQKKVWAEKNIAINGQINKLEENAMSLHQLKVATIQEKGAKNAIEKSKQDFDKAKILRETKFQEELAALGTNVKAKKKLTEEHNKEELAIEEQFLRELIAKFNDIVGSGRFQQIDLELLSPEQVETFKAEAEKLGLTLAELINKRNELLGKEVNNAQALGVSSSADILGFTKENWTQFFANLEEGKFGIDQMIFAVSALTSMYSQYSNFLAANENRDLKNSQKNNEVKKRKLKQQLDAGLINQRQYKTGLERLDEDLEKKKAKIAYKQAKREKEIAVLSAISGTAMAVVGALGNRPWTPANFVLAGIVGAMGLLQLGTILTAPLPSAAGAEDGLYNPKYVKRSQDGKVFANSGSQKMKSGLYNRPTLLVGERGGKMPEMVIDDRAFARMDPGLRDALIRNLNGVPGFESGYYDNVGKYQVPNGSSSSSSSSASNDILIQLVQQNNSLMAQNIAVMEDLRDKGVIGIVRRDDSKSMDEIRKGLKEVTTLRNKSKY